MFRDGNKYDEFSMFCMQQYCELYMPNDVCFSLSIMDIFMIKQNIMYILQVTKENRQIKNEDKLFLLLFRKKEKKLQLCPFDLFYFKLIYLVHLTKKHVFLLEAKPNDKSTLFHLLHICFGFMDFTVIFQC